MIAIISQKLLGPAMAYPAYRAYWVGTLASVIGFQMLNFSQFWIIHELTQSPLYLGYVGLTLPFAFSIGALLEGKIDSKWSKEIRLWILISWVFLTLGITLGSFWAYYELGWGGWWFWDPVENVSLLPWFCLLYTSELPTKA